MGLVLKRNIWMILASPLTQTTASQTQNWSRNEKLKR